MPQERKPRIAISPQALRALKVWAALEEIEPDALVSKLVMDNLPSRVREVVGVVPSEAPREKEPMPSVVREGSRIKEPLHPEGCGVANAVDFSPRKARLADNETALTKIREMWESGEHNAAEITRHLEEMGHIYSRKVVWENIKKMKERGEISDEPAPLAGDEINA